MTCRKQMLFTFSEFGGTCAKKSCDIFDVDMPRIARYTPRSRVVKRRRTTTGYVRGYGAYSYARRKVAPKKRVYKKRNYSYKPKRSTARNFVGGTIRGRGSYHMQGGPQAMLDGTSPPTVRNSKCGFIVRHREFITDIFSSQPFNGLAAYINPGNQSLFPWLASVANQFEEWIPRGIIFEYKTTSTDLAGAGTSPGLGTVIMATDYNVYNGLFANKQQMENYEKAVSCKPSLSMLHQIETAQNETPVHIMYVTASETLAQVTSAAQDARLYFLGLFELATVGMQANGQNIGELWVSYEIEFRKPRMQVGVVDLGGQQGGYEHFVLPAAEYNTVTTAAPFGTVAGNILPTSLSNLGGQGVPRFGTAGTLTGVQYNSGILSPAVSAAATVPGIGVNAGTFVVSAANTYYFPPNVSSGNFLISYSCICSTPGTMSTMPISAFNAIVGDTLFNNGASDNIINVSSGNTSRIMFNYVVSVTGPNASLAFSGTGGVAVATGADLLVLALPSGNIN